MTEQIPRLGDDESVLKEKSVELLLAFDEVVTLGYREKVGMSDLNTILAMESQEEIIQEIIAKVNSHLHSTYYCTDTIDWLE